MSISNSLTYKLAFLGEGDVELKFLESISAQTSDLSSAVYSTKQLEAYRSFACNYCVLYPATASEAVIKSLISFANDCLMPPKIILLLMKPNTKRLEDGFKEMGVQPQIIRLENPDPLRAVELINGFFILERVFELPCPGWEFYGASQPVRNLYDSIKSFARWDKDPVLIFGETGTGKELIARLLHRISGKVKFRAYNLAAVPFELADSLLYGHVKGSFTGALKDTDGYIVEAGDGTLLIDEIGDVHLGIQVKLLRTLQERTVCRVGDDDSNPIKIDARFVFATNRNLEEACSEHKFREDLFHRISALQINVPPLRERKDDSPLLIQHFVEEFMVDYKDATIGLGNILKLNVLFDYGWAGNVRELRNVVRQAAALTGEGEIDKKLAELVEKKITGASGTQLQSSPSQSTQRSRDLSSLMSSLLDDTRLDAEERFKIAYHQNLFLKTNGDIQEMIARSGLGSTVVYGMKSELKNKLISLYFVKEDLIDAAGLATKLKRPTNPVSTYIRSHLYPQTGNLLNEYGGGEPCAMLLDALVKELNRRLQDPNLYQAERFLDIQLSECTQDFIKQEGVWTDLFRLNRMLIEDAYPNEIMRRHLVQPTREGGNEEH